MSFSVANNTCHASPRKGTRTGAGYFKAGFVTKFAKPALSFSEQLAKLQKRGLQVHDAAAAGRFLQNVSYYRLSGYTRAFYVRGANDIETEPHVFKPNVRFAEVIALYEFDRRLRLLVLAAIDRIEVAFRTVCTNYLCKVHGNQWFENADLFFPSFKHEQFLKELGDSICIEAKTGRRREQFLDHYYQKYTSPDLPPGWMLAEIWSLGTWSKIYANLADIRDRKAIAKEFGWSHILIESWAHSLAFLRNCCAHHSRIWNRTFTIRPTVPTELSKVIWKDTSFAAQAMVIHAVLSKKMPELCWPRSFMNLLSEHPNVQAPVMGFVFRWYRDPFWNLEPSVENGLGI